MSTYHIFTDGCCKPNPGHGAIGIVIIAPNGQREELCAHEPSTTNNRAEMLAAIVGLTVVPVGSMVKLYSDSRLLIDGMTKWIVGWFRNGWSASSGPVKNKDLWLKLYQLSRDRKVQWIWVRGHNGDPGNERAHELAEITINKMFR